MIQKVVKSAELALPDKGFFLQLMFQEQPCDHSSEGLFLLDERFLSCLKWMYTRGRDIQIGELFDTLVK